MEREVRYCTSADGVRIAYCVEGEGPPVVECPGIWESFADDWADPFGPWRLGRTVIRYDLRGAGLSQREAPSYTLDSMLADIEAVTRAARVDRFALWGSQFSAAAVVLYAARHPEHVVRLVLSRPFFRSTDVMPRENLDGLVALIRANWEMASQAIADLGIRMSADPTLGVRAAELLRRNMEANALAAMLIDLYESVDVKDVLPDVRCATLIVHRKEDTLFPFADAQHAAAAIPNARLLPLPGSGPVSDGPDAEHAVRTVSAFLDEEAETRALRIETRAPPSKATAGLSAFRAVLFTDIVGHTEMMSRLGDERGREVLREHERITREVLAAHGGTEVKTMGDGFMASFGSVTKSVECAIALQRAFASREGEPLSVRVGLNAGEPIEEDGDLFGATVILASRIAAKAEGGEILVADTVRGLCSGKGFLFADRGEFVAKGFEEPVRVYEVSWPFDSPAAAAPGGSG